ncbi:MAG: GGDEF domain-containing protein [Caldimicrobium sp.]
MKTFMSPNINFHICKFTSEAGEIETSTSIFDSSIGDVALNVPPIHKDSKITEAFQRFMEDSKLGLLPVVDSNYYVIGQLHRHRFLENVILGKYGYGIHLNSKKTLNEVVESPSFVIDYKVPLEEVSTLIQKRELKNLYDDLIITKECLYWGIVPISLLLEVITQKAILLARDSNPLTGLPGNWSIQKEIEKRLKENSNFDICYLDINNFKSYNDHYGFEKGDKVISTLGNILKEMANLFKEIFKNIFIGHLGGDDFILLSPYKSGETIGEYIIRAFEEFLPYFHGPDFIKGYYISQNRKGEEEIFPLLSLTFAIIGIGERKVKSYAQLASIASEVKAEAKRLSKLSKKSIIFRERRKDF